MNKVEYTKIANLNENVTLYWKKINYTKDFQEKELTQLVMRAKYKDELGDLQVREVNLTNKENYKSLYAIKMNALK